MSRSAVFVRRLCVLLPTRGHQGKRPEQCDERMGNLAPIRSECCVFSLLRLGVLDGRTSYGLRAARRWKTRNARATEISDRSTNLKSSLDVPVHHSLRLPVLHRSASAPGQPAGPQTVNICSLHLMCDSQPHGAARLGKTGISRFPIIMIPECQ